VTTNFEVAENLNRAESSVVASMIKVIGYVPGLAAFIMPFHMPEVPGFTTLLISGAMESKLAVGGWG
jgi:hypothetical protein